MRDSTVKKMFSEIQSWRKGSGTGKENFKFTIMQRKNRKRAQTM